jgi:putative PEP-CTERM system TPR-repeat lipoprotein
MSSPRHRPPRIRARWAPRLSLPALLLVAALGATAPAVLAQKDNAKASKLYEDALMRFKEKNDPAGAIVQLRNALKIDKNMLPVHVLLGQALLANQEVAAAEVALTDALRMGVNRAEVVVPLAESVIAQGKLTQFLGDPRFSPAGLPPATQVALLLLRASANTDTGDGKTGLAAVMEARAIQPSNPDTWTAEVPIRLRAREIREAIAAADRAIEIAPAEPEAHYMRGTVAHLQGDTAQALARYAKALELKPDHIESLVSRAGLLIDLKRLVEARAVVDQLRKVAERDPRGHFYASMLAEAANDRAAARAALSKVIEVMDGVPIEYLRYRPQALILAGLAHQTLGQRERALPYLEAAQRAQPGTGVSKLLAQLYLDDKNYDRAVGSLNDYLRGFPGDTQAILMLAGAHMAQGRHARATQLMTEALQRQDRPDLRTMLGMSLIGGGRMKDAVAEFEASLKIDNTQLQPGIALATLFLGSDQPARAARVTEPLLKAHPRNPGVMNLHATALARLNQEANARSLFEQALKIDPAFHAASVNLARLDIRAGRAAEALARLNQVLTADDKNLEALAEAAALHERAGRTADAQRLYEKAEVSSALNDPVAGVALVEFHLRGNRLEPAREALRRVQTKVPDALSVLLVAARVGMAGGDVANARSTLSRAAGIAQFNPGLLVQVALLQNRAGDFKGAQHSLNKALQERPDDSAALALMAEVEIRLGEHAAAEARAKRLVAALPRSGVGHALLGDLALARNQRAAAIEAYRRALQVEPSELALLRVHNAMLPTDPRGALQVAEQWLKNRPRDAAVRRAVADGQARAGNVGAARASYEALVAQLPNDAEVLNNYANVLLIQDTRESIELGLRTAERALALNPGAPYIVGTTGWAAFKAGQNDRALQLLRDARLRDPGNAQTRFFLGSVLAAMGRKVEAREEVAAAVNSGRLSNPAEAQALLATLR